MATVKVYDQNKQESGEVTLASDVFEIEVRPEILNLVARAQMAAKRAGTHSVKTRAFVSGGGAKPWKQKGTGRARAGSNRSPIWRGGAITFGPSPRDYSFKVNKKVKQLARKSAFSLKAQNNAIIVVEDFEFDAPKTQRFLELTKNLQLADKKLLFVLPNQNKNVYLSARNLNGIEIITASDLNTYKIMSYPSSLIFSF